MKQSRNRALATMATCALAVGCGDRSSGILREDAGLPDALIAEADAPSAGAVGDAWPEVAKADLIPAEPTRADAGRTDSVLTDAAALPLPPDAATILADAGTFSSSSTQTLTQLSTPNRQVLCDQLAIAQGGYGRVVQCDGGMQTTDINQASCVSGISSIASLCPTLTVGNLVGCANATGPDLCMYPIVPECSEVFKCVG